MEGSELEQWEAETLSSVILGPDQTITLSNMRQKLQVVLLDPMAYGAVIYISCEDPYCEGHPIVFAWRYPCMN
jgi:hypothetical protein